MSNVLEKAKQKLSVISQEKTLKLSPEAAMVKQRINKEAGKQIEQDRLLLEKSGVISLFEEIINSGLVKLNDKPVIKREPVYKNKLFGGRVVDHYNNVKVSEYTPAYMIIDKNDFILPERPVVQIGLHFDEYPIKDWEKGARERITHSEIRLIVLDGKLNLIGGEEHYLSPINEGELKTTVLRQIEKIQKSHEFIQHQPKRN